MESYLFIGGSRDCLYIPVASDVDVLQLWTDVAGIENYISETLSVGDVSITVYRHESLTPQQVLDLLVSHYKSCAVNQSVSRS
jgi:hypothetical protein